MFVGLAHVASADQTGSCGLTRRIDGIPAAGAVARPDPFFGFLDLDALVEDCEDSGLGLSSVFQPPNSNIPKKPESGLSARDSRTAWSPPILSEVSLIWSFRVLTGGESAP